MRTMLIFLTFGNFANYIWLFVVLAVHLDPYHWLWRWYSCLFAFSTCFRIIWFNTRYC